MSNILPDISIERVAGKRDFDAFVDLAYRLNAGDPNWVPPLRAEVVELLTPGKNPFHDHAKVQLFLARRGGRGTAGPWRARGTDSCLASAARRPRRATAAPSWGRSR